MVKLPLPQATCGEINSYLCSPSCLAIHLTYRCVEVREMVLMERVGFYPLSKMEGYLGGFGLYQVITDDSYGWETQYTDDSYGWETQYTLDTPLNISKNLEKGGVKCLSRANEFQHNLMITYELLNSFEFELSIVDGRIMEYYEPGGENDVGGYKLVDLERLNNIVYFVDNVLEQIRTHDKE